jgi:uncharacterized protein (TIGR00255 family)
MMSMTGYGSASVETESLSAAVWVRSLNHRYLDLTVHAPRRLAFLEPALKERVAARLQRGRVELTLRALVKSGSGEEVLAASGLVASLVGVLRTLRAEHGLAGDVSVSDVMRFPGALELAELPREGDAELRRVLLALAVQALDALDAMRRAEGARLAEELHRLLDEVATTVERLRALAESGRQARLAALCERGRALVGELGVDEPRLYQELARLVDRSDVSEELQRLMSHAQQSRALVDDGGAGPVGKRLDFLAQELMREANTLGSKAASGAMVQQVVALKAAIERWREQVQNVE